MITVEQSSAKRCQNIFIRLKKDLFGVVLDREERDKDNEIGLKEGGGIEMSTTVLSIYAMLALFRFLYLLTKWVLIYFAILFYLRVQLYWRF